MSEINFMSVIVAALAAFITGAVWNTVLFGNLIMKHMDPSWDREKDDTKMAFWKLPVEFIRCFIVALILAWFVMQIGVNTWGQALQTGALIWFGFPAMILSGAVLWENEPWKLALVHVGDWLLKLLVMTVIIVSWF